MNPNTYQLLQIATLLLYFNAGSALLSHVISFGGATPYYFLGLKLGGGDAFARGGNIFLDTGGSATTVGNLFEAAAIVGLIYAGGMIASGRKIGWQLGVGLASGLVAIPVLLFGAKVLSTGYAITWMFDIALLVTLVHPTSRSYQKTWFS